MMNNHDVTYFSSSNWSGGAVRARPLPETRAVIIVWRSRPFTPDYGDNAMESLRFLCSGLRLDPLPAVRPRDPSVPHAPVRNPNLSREEKRVSKSSNEMSTKSGVETCMVSLTLTIELFGAIFLTAFVEERT